jgi:hypothetical protein
MQRATLFKGESLGFNRWFDAVRTAAVIATVSSHNKEQLLSVEGKASSGKRYPG